MKDKIKLKGCCNCGQDHEDLNLYLLKGTTAQTENKDVYQIGYFICPITDERVYIAIREEPLYCDADEKPLADGRFLSDILVKGENDGN